MNPSDAGATRVVVSINDLFAIEAEAGTRNLDQQARQELRWEQARPLLETIRDGSRRPAGRR
ncbi:MAG: hypothetical protein IT158_22500 [Bryobacterales bacterium]|nr:hypothetical protein [Bryobacterales bacterium]